MKQRREITCNNPESQEVRAINKEIAESIQKDIRQYNKEHIQQTIEQNKSLKVLRRKLNNGRKEIIKLKNKKGETISDRKEILTRDREDKRSNQPRIRGNTKDCEGKIKNALKKMKNGKAPGEDGKMIEAVRARTEEKRSETRDEERKVHILLEQKIEDQTNGRRRHEDDENQNEVGDENQKKSEKNGNENRDGREERKIENETTRKDGKIAKILE
ncbi:hypothetical protein ILUMI_21746 [Ignelater luminosus]|uniref:Uncharacterized protein n=1 Tax=Ignelater luminosus TaxID=2038154 RepID=A0A8K0CI55_IGNLU|nr:hypothetical protein ILUMI_21746 [Ignelater luminosus]